VSLKNVAYVCFALQVDETFVAVLRMTRLSTLDEYVPVAIEGDDNRLFRAVSLANFGPQQYHIELRMRTACEVKEYSQWYDVKSTLYRRTTRLSIGETSPFDDVVTSCST
jgi:hypothetical protein